MSSMRVSLFENRRIEIPFNSVRNLSPVWDCSRKIINNGIDLEFGLHIRKSIQSLLLNKIESFETSRKSIENKIDTGESILVADEIDCA